MDYSIRYFSQGQHLLCDYSYYQYVWNSVVCRCTVCIL